MPTVCCAVGCKHTSESGVCKLKRFPSDTERSILWEKNLRRSYWIRKEWERLCECHFHLSQFEKVREDGAKKLKHNAVPTLFPTHTVPLAQVGSRKYSTETHAYPIVHFEESAFESHRADGLRKLKPNAVPTIHSVSSSANRKRKKQKTDQRIEFTFGENDKESFVLAEKVQDESKEVDAIQISEVYCNELDMMKKKPERRKRLKTIHVTEIVSNGSSIPVNKRGRPPKKRINGRGIKLARSKSALHQSFSSCEEIDQTFEASDTPIAKENPQLVCYVCNRVINPGHGVSLSIQTEATRVSLVQRLNVITSMEGLDGHCGSLQDVVCRRCASLLNHVDRTEAELDVLKGAISVCAKRRNLNKKLNQDPEYDRNVQLLDRFGSLNGGNYNILSLDELFLIQEESGVISGIVLEGKEGIEQSRAYQEPNFVENNTSEVDETSIDIHVHNCSSSVIGGSKERPLSSRSQANVESAMNESVSTNIIITPDVPDCNTTPCLSNVKKYRQPDNHSSSSYINIRSAKDHMCKICNFNTPHDSVMIWHLRMHMKEGRWCDFCNVSIPMEESPFLSMKKKVESTKTRRKPIAKPVISTILPITAKEAFDSIKPINLPLIPIENVKAPSPVIMISNKSDCSQVVNFPDAIVELPKNVETVEGAIEDPKIIENNTQPIVDDKPEVLEGKGQDKVDAQLSKQLSLEGLCRSAESGGKELTVGNVVTLREDLNATVNGCDNHLPAPVVQDFSSSPDQAGDHVSNGCSPVNDGGFSNDTIQEGKDNNLNDREVFCEDSVEHSFLDTLSSQQEGKFPEILPEICSEPSEQGMISIANDPSEGNMTNKDVSFARNDSLGENELAIAYENSVAALMCQSDDSEGILSYH